MWERDIPVGPSCGGDFTSTKTGAGGGRATTLFTFSLGGIGGSSAGAGTEPEGIQTAGPMGTELAGRDMRCLFLLLEQSLEWILL